MIPGGVALPPYRLSEVSRSSEASLQRGLPDGRFEIVRQVGIFHGFRGGTIQPNQKLIRISAKDVTPRQFELPRKGRQNGANRARAARSPTVHSLIAASQRER